MARTESRPLVRPRPAAAGLIPWWPVGVLLLLAMAAVAAGRSGAGGVPIVQTFVLVFTSIVVEALPFILLGALVSALIAVYVPDRAFSRVGRLPLPLQLPFAALGGFAFPVCECGSVPVARRLITRGMHPAAGLAFMLASPVLNPIVLVSTAIAYRGLGLSLEMVLGRVVLGFATAVAAGWALGGDTAAETLRPAVDRDGHGEAHAGSAGHASREDGRSAFADHLSSDFFYMGAFVVAGAAVAAALQTVIPQTLVSGVAQTPVVGSLALMAIAFVLSLCSEADAFVAVSFAQFPLGAQLAFLVFGPAVDTKLAFLYSATFKRRFVLRLIGVAAPVTLAGSLWFEALIAR
jgi:uncharacterized protein